MRPALRLCHTLLPLALLLLATPAGADIGAVGNFYADTFGTKEVHPRAGILANSTPYMAPVKVPTWSMRHYNFTAFSTYFVHARVLAKEHYILGRMADLSPYDVALGWEEMSDSNVLDRMSISQSDRWWYYSWRGTAPMPADAVPLKSGNMHIIPADDEVLSNLRKLAKGNVISLSGYLVNVRADDGWGWNSGTSTNSSGPHGCKLIWVTKIEIER